MVLFKIRFTSRDENGEWLPQLIGYTFESDPFPESAFCRKNLNYEKKILYKRGKYYTWLQGSYVNPYEVQ